MNIIKEKWLFLNATVSHAPKQIKRLYEFCLQTISAEQVVSLRANARLAGLRWATAKSKIWRLTKNGKVVGVFPQVIASFASITAEDMVAVDFSDFGNGFQVLAFAKRTNRGRALPLYFETLHYPIPKDSQNLFVNAAILRFGNIFGVKPILVFDRGFACPAIIKFLEENQWKYIVRVKGGKYFMNPKTGKVFAARRAPRRDQPVIAYGKCLRLIISDEQENTKEPWYLLTNDTEATRDEIVDRYYHRFEIEEFFRDAKRLLGLEWVSWKTETSLAVTLWFVILGIFCLEYIASRFDDLAKQAREKMQLSEIRYTFELLKAAIRYAAEGKYIHSYDV